MPKFSATSTNRLNTCHKDLITLFNEVVKIYDCSIICGHRNKADQDAAVKSGASKTPWPQSKHNSTPSMAVDVGPYPIDWNNSKRWYHFAGFVRAMAVRLLAEGKMTHALRWGGDWDKDFDLDDEKFRDLPHFELISPGK